VAPETNASQSTNAMKMVMGVFLFDRRQLQKGVFI
jgi:hypothetical protein